MTVLRRYWGHLAFVVVFAIVGASSASMDALSDYRQETVYAEWAEGDGNMPAFGQFMIAGPENRQWISDDWPKPIQSMARGVSDGWHVAKAIAFGLPMLFAVVLLTFDYSSRVFRRLWLELIVWIAAGYAALGGTFFILYHRLLHAGPGWWGI